MPWVRGARFRYAHLAAIGVVVLQAWFGIECPLTTLESALRTRAGEAGYGMSFIQDFGAAVALVWWFAPPVRRQSGPDRLD